MKDSSTSYKLGSIHGRFQPFHIGHAQYLKAALARCDYLYIGITQFDIHNLGTTTEAQHRSVPANNPFSYLQRCEIIAAYLDAEGIDRARYDFTPFPIEEPVKIKDFIPLDTVCFTTLHSAWNEAKIQKLKDVGFIVEVLLHPDNSITKNLSSTLIRGAIRQHDDGWKENVPVSSAKKLEALGGLQIIRQTE